MTSKDIIIKLIDEDKITGEEAYMLLNDIFKAEMVAVNETLKDAAKTSGIEWINPYGYTTSSSTINTYDVAKVNNSSDDVTSCSSVWSGLNQ